MRYVNQIRMVLLGIALFFLLVSISPLLPTMISPVMAQSCVPPPSGLTGWWPGDEDASDISGNNNHAVLMNGVKAAVPGKVGGAFGAHGWSTEAQDRIYNTMKEIFKMDMTKGPLLLKSASLGGGVQMAQEYGKEIGSKLSP